VAKRAARAVECEEGEGDVFAPRGLGYVVQVWQSQGLLSRRALVAELKLELL
jgi:hypothetical protein